VTLVKCLIQLSLACRLRVHFQFAIYTLLLCRLFTLSVMFQVHFSHLMTGQRQKPTALHGTSCCLWRPKLSAFWTSIKPEAAFSFFQAYTFSACARQLRCTLRNIVHQVTHSARFVIVCNCAFVALPRRTIAPVDNQRSCYWLEFTELRRLTTVNRCLSANLPTDSLYICHVCKRNFPPRLPDESSDFRRYVGAEFQR
jgi:hypothetical protein